MQDPRFHALVLHRLPQVGAATYSKLVELFGSPESVLTQSLAKLQAIVHEETLAVIKDFQSLGESSKIAQKVFADLDWLNSQTDVHLVALADSIYPELLRQIPKLPPLLLVSGDIHLLSLPQIAIVGSRNPSSGGSENAHRFAEFLAGNGFSITSGLALGVDAAAHQGALAAKGKTIAVMGTGIDSIYPARHKGLAQQILDNG